jgi:ethanolamine utilization protein EutN
MDLAKVVGRVVCSAKDASLEGIKLLLVRPLGADGTPARETLVALDAVGAGAGETVFYTSGREASFAFLPAHVAADVTIVGIVDAVYRPDREQA